MNVPAHIQHWRKGAEEALLFAEETILKGKIDFGLFFAHLALEKILKAHVVKTTQAIPPYIHNLVRLAEIGAISLSADQKYFLGVMNEFNISGRYSEFVKKSPRRSEADRNLQRCKELIQWLIQQL